ncbi:probable GPI-anchored adhesin-like protein PGA55 isoform X2 [Hevea brasiliensis]|uniref:probable GPI-anchored adhesin-like protein PGA55 isoform X2 n=1 Tax=Hevea brasiliensis TaxID=3981 RepID=UPI0025CE8776|nr:probable GPI-anchored adhesin-like protein PGA55 isoform X2 [Hevea brasiliensis]
MYLFIFCGPHPTHAPFTLSLNGLTQLGVSRLSIQIQKAILREDDSLLSVQQISHDDATTDKSYFSCSPLLRIPRSTCSRPPPPLLASPIESINGTEATCIPGSSSCEDSRENSMNKENANLNKPEAPKLSLEPQQMKRKKKGGGYNLRKSLAWDRAFFTEEGVLDPLELSMLSGPSGKSSGETLSVIHEGRESLCGGLDSTNDSSDLQSLEDNIFKELPSNTPNENRKIAAKFPPKLGSPAKEKKGPASAAKRKVLSTHDINRSASKRSGCPQPVASSYLKKPSNVITAKVATKTSSVSKLLAPKPDPSVVSTTSGSSTPDPSVVSTTSRSSVTSVSHSKRNYDSQPVNARKNVGLKGTSTNTKTVQNNAKSAPVGKSIIKSMVHQARRNVVNSVPEIHSSSKVQLSQVSQSNDSSEVVPDSVVPSVAHPAKGHDSNTNKIAVSFSQIDCFNGRNMQSTQPQPAKPSGLRMPSPSLGFFGQSKPSGLRSLLQRSTQSCNLPESNIPNLSKTGVLNPTYQRPPRPSRNIPSSSNGAYSVVSTINAASCGKIKSNTELNNMQKVALKVQLNSESFDTTNCKQQLHEKCDDADPQSLDLAEPCKILKISSMELKAEQSNNNKLPFQSGPCEELEQDNDRSVINVCLRTRDATGSGLGSSLSLPMEVEGPVADNTIVNQNVENGEYSPSIKEHSFCSESQSAGVKSNWDGAALKVHEDKKQSPQQAELMKPDNCQGDSISNVESQRLNDILFEDSRSSEDLNKHDSSNAVDASLEVQECGATANCQSHSTDIEPAKDGTIGMDYLNRELHVGDAQMLYVDGNLLDESSKSSVSTSTVDNSNLTIIDDPSSISKEQAELPNPCLVRESLFQDNCGPPFIGCLLHEKGYEEAREKDALLSVKSDELRTSACEGELGSSNVLFSISPINHDSGLDGAEKVEFLHMENDLTASVDSEPVVENFRHDIESDEANASTVERMDKSRIFGTVITGGVKVNNYCLTSGDFRGNELENPHVTAEISSVIQVEVANGMNDVSEHDCVIDKQLDSSTTNFTVISDLQPGKEACYKESGTSILHNDCFVGMCDVKEQFAEQVKLINSCSHKQVNQSQEAHDNLLCHENRSFEGVIIVGESISEIPHSSLKCEIMEHELAGVDKMIKDTLMEDAVPLPQSLDENLSADSHNRSVSISLTDKKSSPMVDDIIRQPKQCLELQNLGLMIDQVPLGNHGLCSGDNLLLMNTSVESPERDTAENVSGTVLEQCNGFPAGSRSFEAYIQAPPVTHDNNFGHPSMDPSIENIKFYMDCKCRNDELDNQAHPLNFCSSSKTNGDQKASAANTFDSNETLEGSMQQDVEVLAESKILPVEAETAVHKSNGGINSETQDGIGSAVCSEVVKEATFSLKKSGNDKRHDALVIRPPPNAVPFSDEWLAAFEAAGEEILTMKGGAVQNSPQDKSLPEPGPWSPVRRKNNQAVGPFDCTKFTNTNIPSSTSN